MPFATRRLRVGIDVGGTFTDVVAVDAATRALVAAVKVPTTHDHADGVAAGIVAGLETLLRDHAIDPDDVAFIAHSTTQATNALLEGDLARVGVVRLARGPLAPLVRAAMGFGAIPTGPSARFAPEWLDGADGPEAVVAAARARGLEALAASEAFAVDRPHGERAVVDAARAAGIPATGGADVSAMYGLRARTRTAALNAAILPRMLRTARVTRRAVDDARIPAPLMVMRSDGGVMDVAEVERRPILTVLSGPAAGIAGALFHENVTDGIFVEVGGTSADCSVVVRGRPQVRPARIGGHRTLLRTLDVRTVGIAGGSLVHVDGSAVTSVGPRSAHIAGYRYAAFASEAEIVQARVDLSSGIAALSAPGGPIAITPTCAANALGLVPDGAFSRGDPVAARAACAAVGAALGSDAESFARAVLERATDALRPTIAELVAEYGLDPATTTIVGGGGGAGALVPFAAERLGFAWRIARDAQVISPLGVALALVRDVVERTIVDPSPADLARIRREAVDAAIASGAAPDRVEVVVDVDRARNRVRATASGATALVEGATQNVRCDETEQIAAAARQLRREAETLRIVARTPSFAVVGGTGERLAVVDERGVVRMLLDRAEARDTTAGALEPALRRLIDDRTAYGDVGRAIPDVFVLRGARIGEFTGLAESDAIVALVLDDLAGVEGATPVVLIAAAVRA